MADIEQFLKDLRINFIRYEHPAVFTCDQVADLDREMTGTDTKNLFLRDRKGKRHFLVAVGHAKSADLKQLSVLLGADKLSFGSPERLKERLGVEPGSVTLLALINDRDNDVEVIIDKEIDDADRILCHPLINTATLSIATEDMRRFFEATGHAPSVLTVPERPTS